MNSIDQVAEFFAEHDIDRKAFDKAMNSFEVKTNMRRSQELVRRYKLTGFPPSLSMAVIKPVVISKSLIF